MYGITLPSGSHKKSGKYAYEDLTLSKYTSEVYGTLVRSLSEETGQTQTEVRKDLKSKRSQIDSMIEECFPDVSVTNCTKKIMTKMKKFIKKEVNESSITDFDTFVYWNDVCEELDSELELNESNIDESESGVDKTLDKYAEEYANKVIRGKKISPSSLKRILKKVHSRGMQAFRNAPQSVRPWIRKMGDPAGAIVWGTSRVKAFLKKSKGTWHKFDSDLAADVKKSAN